MADTDSPLKQLFSAFITDFAAWLLQAEVREAHPLQVELPAETLAASPACGASPNLRGAADSWQP